MTTANLHIVPPRRLGTLLSGARGERGLTLAEAAERSSIDPDTLASIEAGEVPVTDDVLDEVLSGYGTTMGEILPDRGQVLVDLDAGRLVVADEVTRLDGAPSADEVLGAYLSLVYSLRRATPGSVVVLREFDVAVLAAALDLAAPEVETRLQGLMVEPTPEVRRLTKILHSRLVLPMAGALAVATALGTVLVLRSDPAPVEVPTSVQRYGSVPPPEVGPAVSVARDDDGSVSPAVVVTPDR